MYRETVSVATHGPSLTDVGLAALEGDTVDVP